MKRLAGAIALGFAVAGLATAGCDRVKLLFADDPPPPPRALAAATPARPVDSSRAIGNFVGPGNQDAAGSPGSPAAGPTSELARPQERIQVVARGWGGAPSPDRGGQFLRYGYAFLVDNPTRDIIATDVDYQVVAYDRLSSVVKTATGHVPFIWPDQKTGIAGTFDLDKDLTIDRIQIQLLPKKFTRADAAPKWTVANVTYLDHGGMPRVTALIRNPFPRDANDVTVSAVLFDANDQIIGGGVAFVDFVPANGQAAAEIPVSSSTAPVRAEVYPQLSTLSVLGE